jgi:hypothetical protein
MLSRRHALKVCAAFALGACATGPNVQTDSDPTADFSGFRNYMWAYSRPQPGVSALVWQRTRDAIDRTLQRRGFALQEPAQFAVGFTLGSRTEIRIDDFGPFYARYRPGRGGWGTFGGPQTRTTTRGTLTIDVFDVATQRPVWSGAASQRIGSNVDQTTIDAAVESVLASFPPNSG